MPQRIFPGLLFAVALGGCTNTTARMDVPVVGEQHLLSVSGPARMQPSFALSKVVADIPRGTAIANFPAAGVDGVEGFACNERHQGNSTLDWRTGTTVLGNWSTELGRVFYQALSRRGLNVAGNPEDLFGRKEAVAAAEYLIGARIRSIRGNFCEAHTFWGGDPTGKYAGEMFVDVEWTVFSSLRQRVALKTGTRGYYKQVKSKREGIIIAFQEAFAVASENLLASRDFVALASGKAKLAPAIAPSPRTVRRFFTARRISTRPLSGRIDEVLPAVVTVRVGAAHGSGFVIDEDGLLLTNQHVVGTARQVGVILSNGVEVRGKVLRWSRARDVALVRIPLRVPSYLPVRTDAPKLLERVFVIGTPMRRTLRSTVTSGVISAVRREKRTGLSFIQSDAAISPGNSGGPLLDGKGNVIGISVQKFVGDGAEGLNLFIPIGDALGALGLAARRASS